MLDDSDDIKRKNAERKAERERIQKARSEKRARARNRAAVRRHRKRNAERIAKQEAAKRREEKKLLAEFDNEQKVLKRQSQANAAERELASRTLSRRHLLPFVMRMMPGYKAGWVHKDICIRLERFLKDIEEGKQPRLMLQMPPRHGKSLLASQFFPAWALGQHPEYEIISSSYSGSLATGFSRKVRSLLRDPLYKVLFPSATLDPDNQNAEGWLTTKGGGFVPAGVGGAITGKGAHILIIDDPVKNAEEAESETSRQNVKDWYSSTAYTRLAPQNGVLVIQTRWHDDDLSGWLEHQMNKGEGDEWEIIRYPAEALEDEKYRRKGDALHPARYPIEMLKKIMKAVGPRVWNALYQQNPTPDDGEYFKREQVKYYPYGQQPELLTIYAAWDFAIGKNETNDFTVGVVIGLDVDGNFWLLDVRKGRWGSDEIINEMIDVQRTWHPVSQGAEQGQIQMSIGPFLEKRIQEERVWELHIEPLKTGRRDKPARARTLQGMMQALRVKFPLGAPWLDDLINEMLRFPNGKHDDQVDAFAWVALMINEMTQPHLPKPPKPTKKSWKEKLNRLTKTRRVGGVRSPMTS